MTHRIGIIGLGTVGSRFVEQFNHHDDFELVAAWDPDPAACANHAGAVHLTDDAAAVIDSSDAVYIAVPRCSTLATSSGVSQHVRPCCARSRSVSTSPRAAD